MKVNMKIQQYNQFKAIENFYSPLQVLHDFKISYVAIFLYRVSGHVYRKGGPATFLNSLIIRENGECGMTFDMVDLNVDIQNNLVYLGEIFDSYQQNMTDEEFNIKYNSMTALQLCQNNIVDCAVMTKDNFIHLLSAWEKLLNTMSPFVLLYQDDKDWYDLLPFDSQQAMEKFLIDHTKREIILK